MECDSNADCMNFKKGVSAQKSKCAVHPHIANMPNAAGPIIHI